MVVVHVESLHLVQVSELHHKAVQITINKMCVCHPIHWQGKTQALV